MNKQNIIEVNGVYQSYHTGIETCLSDLQELEPETINRTILELKQDEMRRLTKTADAINRTILELKQQ